MTITGTRLGTPAYMSPEQARGLGELDARVDVFALGCVLFECLSGQKAFSGEDAMALTAKILLEEEDPVGYAQFGPLSAYPRALRTRDLYPRLPASPLPAVITCIATTPEVRSRGLAAMLVEAVCDDLASRGFAAVETYPEVGAEPDATSAAGPGFWERLGFAVAAPDERFPVMRRELG